MKYRKKPVVIEAWNVYAPGAKMAEDSPTWLLAAIMGGVVEMIPSGGANIKTLEGTMRADVGDWIIRGVKKELYPCKPDVFAATYEPA